MGGFPKSLADRQQFKGTGIHFAKPKEINLYIPVSNHLHHWPF